MNHLKLSQSWEKLTGWPSSELFTASAASSLMASPSLQTSCTQMSYPEFSRYWDSLPLKCMAEEGQLDIFICEQEEGVNISANTVHPGVIATSLFKNRTIVNGNSHISRAILQSENFKMTILS
jgi:hypothetical protein